MICTLFVFMRMPYALYSRNVRIPISRRGWINSYALIRLSNIFKSSPLSVRMLFKSSCHFHGISSRSNIMPPYDAGTRQYGYHVSSKCSVQSVLNRSACHVTDACLARQSHKYRIFSAAQFTAPEYQFLICRTVFAEPDSRIHNNLFAVYSTAFSECGPLRQIAVNFCKY